MMTYQKLFSEYGHRAAQILMTKNTMIDNLSRRNASNTFDELIKLGAIPVVNENDTVSTYEIQFGDNDTLSAIVSALTHADLLLLLSDIDGLYTDDPRKNPGAQFIDLVDKVDDHYMKMGKGSGSDVGTGGMATKLSAAKIANASGADMIIANGDDFHVFTGCWTVGISELYLSDIWMRILIWLMCWRRIADRIWPCNDDRIWKQTEGGEING